MCKPCRRGWGLIPVVVSRHVVQDVLSCGERGRARDGADPYDSSRHDSQSHRTSNATAFSIQKGAWTYATAFQLKVPSITRPGSADGPQRDALATRAVWTMQAGHAKTPADSARDPTRAQAMQMGRDATRSRRARCGRCRQGMQKHPPTARATQALQLEPQPAGRRQRNATRRGRRVSPRKSRDGQRR